MALRQTTIDRISEALEIVDRIEREHKNKFKEMGLLWTGEGNDIIRVLEEASSITHYSVKTLQRYRGEKPAKKGKFAHFK